MGDDERESMSEAVEHIRGLEEEFELISARVPDPACAMGSIADAVPVPGRGGQAIGRTTDGTNHG